VKVQVLMDLTASDAGESFNTASGEILKGWGAQVRQDPLTVITHAKFLIVDDVVVMGTNNWGYMGFVLDHEAGLVIRGNAKLLGDLLAYFGKIWAESTPL
jgi:phosphatidylserine/phosphatidylglycerophosphate/cardiolipin synthase-like enzyme